MNLNNNAGFNDDFIIIIIINFCVSLLYTKFNQSIWDLGNTLKSVYSTITSEILKIYDLQKYTPTCFNIKLGQNEIP